jgi:hypothetical protein
VFSPKKIIEYVELLGDRTNVELAYRSVVINNKRVIDLNIHSTLRVQLENLLTDVGVIQKVGNQTIVNQDRARLFFSHIDAVQLAKDYSWQPRQRRPKLFTSPPELIPQSMAADVDDIRNLITELVSGAKESLTIMSPYTTAKALRDILKPLSHTENIGRISIKVFIANPLEDAKRQINTLKKMIPESIFRNITFFYRADFTSQGLGKHFELGIEMSPEQAKLSVELLEHLVSKQVFLKI